MNLSETNQAAADEILDLLEHKPIAFLGSGVSRDYFMSWSELLKDVANRMGEPIDKSLGNVEQAQALYDVNSEVYTAALVDIFGKDPSDCSNALLNLVKCPFKSYITTNYDWSIQRAHRLTDQPRPKTYAYSDLLETRCHIKSIHHIHGTVNERAPLDSKFVLHRDSYREAYYDEKVLSIFMASALFHNPILFVGFSLSADEPLNDILDLALRHIGESGEDIENYTKKRAILLPKSSTDEEITRFNKLGLRVIEFEPEAAFSGFNSIWRHIALESQGYNEPESPIISDSLDGLTQREWMKPQ